MNDNSNGALVASAHQTTRREAIKALLVLPVVTAALCLAPSILPASPKTLPETVVLSDDAREFAEICGQLPPVLKTLFKENLRLLTVRAPAADFERFALALPEMSDGRDSDIFQSLVRSIVETWPY